MNAEYLRSLGGAAIVGGEFEGGLVRLSDRLESADGFEEENKILPRGLKPTEGRSSMSELNLRPPKASVSEPPAGERERPQGSEDSALRYRVGDALKRAPTTFVANSGTSVEKTAGLTQSEPMISLERLKFEVPDRAGLAPIAKYAHLVVPGDGYRVVGSTEASRGCKHLCRHCPIVPVYNGVVRVWGRSRVLWDGREQAAWGG